MAEQDVLKLVGLSLGRSKEPAKLRLYLTRNFSRYFEFSKEDTLHSERSSTGGVIAWLTPGAQVVEMTMPASVPADFVQGGLLDKLSKVSDAETIRRLLGLGMGVCDSKKDDPPQSSTKETGTCFGGVSCPKDAGHCGGI
jgi:hypothetical protein